MANFPFIVSTGPRKNEDPKVRQLIRKQAMKDVGLSRRRKGNYGRVNMRQSITADNQIEASVTTDSDNSTASTSTSADLTPDGLAFDSDSWVGSDSWDELYTVEADSDAFNLQQNMLACIPHPRSFVMPFSDTGYEHVRSTFGVSLVDLSVLTNFNIGKAAIATLSKDPCRFASLLEHRQWSFLEYIPARYESSPCLSAATDCVLAKVANVLTGTQSQSASLRLYAKALEQVQSAITDQTESSSRETLCSIQLLSLFELLDPTRGAAWAQHVNGAARLMNHRSAARFVTEFDKALFASHVGGILSESLVGGTHCYLEQAEWTELYKSIVRETEYLTDRSSLVVNARLLMFDLPGLWHDLHLLVDSDGFFDDEAVQKMQSRCLEPHSRYLDWMEEYKAHCVRTSLIPPTSSELGLRREIFGAALECLMVVKRLLATVCERDRLKLEMETQALARLILDLQDQPSPKHSWLFSTHEVGVASSAMVSREAWEEDLSSATQEVQRMAARKRYMMWSSLLRGH